ILTRLLALTLTAYKFLKIRIVVGPTPHIEIAIGDTRGNRIILPYAWMAFIEKWVDIQRLVQSSTPSKVMIVNLVIELVKIRDVGNVKLSLIEKCLYMKLSTILFMLELEQCVKHIFRFVSIYINIISDKFKYFVIHLRQNCINNNSDAIDTLRRIATIKFIH
ncbi:hypothetical protein ALC56_15313, partial [Trachymyrmex septentrionalis]